MNPRIKYTIQGECWICTSHAADSVGYPAMTRMRPRRISRQIMFEKYGEQPPSIVTRHTCDNRLCVNPDHILKGTPKDNTRDMHERGRHIGNTKLSIETVIAIRQSTGTCRSVAKQFGISYGTVYQIKTGQSWKKLK